MTRSIFTTTTIAALIAAPMALANPNTTENVWTGPAGENVTAVAPDDESGNDVWVGPNGEGTAALEPNLTKGELETITQARGAAFKTNDGEVIGMIKKIGFDGEGNPRFHVAVEEEGKYAAETLIVSMLPSSVDLQGRTLIVDTTEAELIYRAFEGSVSDDLRTKTIIVF